MFDAVLWVLPRPTIEHVQTGRVGSTMADDPTKSEMKASGAQAHRMDVPEPIAIVGMGKPLTPFEMPVQGR